MDLAGVYPPIATPFDAGGEVDPGAIRSNITRLIDSGVRGVVALGSNGEAPLLDEGESDRVLAAARHAVPTGRLLLAGTGRESTRATIAASRRAAALGVDAILVRTPSYFKARMTPSAFVAHYTAVAEAAAVPVILYNYPAVTGVNLTPATVGELARHPNIIGIKETSTDAAQMAAYVDATRGEAFAVLAGSAPGFYAALCLGARGGILAAACVVPRACVGLLEAYARGDHETARDLQRRMIPIAAAVTGGYGVAGLKLAMDMAGYTGGAPRRPLEPAPADAAEALRTAFAHLADHI